MIREFVILTALFSQGWLGKLSSRSVMQQAVFAREVLKQRVRGCVGAQISEPGTLPPKTAFYFSSFPQAHTAGLYGRRGIQCVTKSETSEGSRRNA